MGTYGAAIQTAALESRTSQLVALRIADKTAKVYESGARAYIRFAMFYRYTPILPASDAALVAFVAFQSQSSSHDTLQGYMSHIRDIHLRNGFQFKPVAERWLVKSFGNWHSKKEKPGHYVRHAAHCCFWQRIHGTRGGVVLGL